MSLSILLAFVTGVLVGGFVVDVNIRSPERIKAWLASWFPEVPPK